MLGPIMKIVTGDGIKIQLALWGNKGKPILCLHGITANCRSWDCLASDFGRSTSSHGYGSSGKRFFG